MTLKYRELGDRVHIHMYIQDIYICRVLIEGLVFYNKTQSTTILSEL